MFLLHVIKIKYKKAQYLLDNFSKNILHLLNMLQIVFNNSYSVNIPNNKYLPLIADNIFHK